MTKAIPRKPSIQRNRSSSSSSLIGRYKRTAAIPLLHSLIIQMQDQFSDKDRHARHLLCLVPSIIVNKALHLDNEVKGMLYWEKDIPFPKSLGNEVRRWKTLWQSTNRELPNNLLVIACTLPITSAEY